MNKHSISRRKFLTGMGVTTGVVVAASSKGKGRLLDAWARPTSSPQHRQLKTVSILNRAPGSHQLPLSKRPF